MLHPVHFNIEDTVVALRQGRGIFSANRDVEVVKLAGDTNEVFVKLYLKDENRVMPEWLGLTLRVNKLGYTFNFLVIRSTFKTFKLAKGDIVVLHFADSSRLEVVAERKSIKDGNGYNRTTVINDIQLMQLCEIPLNYAEVISEKFNESANLYFVGGSFNRQYPNEVMGQKLLGLMAKRIAGGKELLFEKIE